MLFAKIRGDPDTVDLAPDWEAEAVYSLVQGPLHQLALGDYLDDEDVSALNRSKRSADAKIKKEIYDRFLSEKPLNDIRLFGDVYRFWLERKHRPTVEDIARFKCISRSQCYRLGYTSTAIRWAYHEFCERIRTEIPGHDTVASASDEDDQELTEG